MPVDNLGDEPEETPGVPTEDEYAAFDPRTVSASTTGPAASSDAPQPTDLEPHRGVDEDTAERPEEVPLPEFDRRWAEPLQGLLFIGALTKSFTSLGHRFVIKTQTVGEILEIGLLIAPYMGTVGETKAYQAANAAASIVSVDGQPIAIPLTDEPDDTILRSKFEYIQQHWFPPILDVVYEEYLALEGTVEKVVAAMGESLG